MRKLATGGMAEVYLAKVAGPGGFEKLVVLKRILPSLSDNDVYVKMFLSEARLAAQLDHPNIVHVFDFGEVEGSYFLTMEYVDGANLRQVLRWAIRSGHPLAPPLAAKIIALACEGLAYAHEFVAPGDSEVTRLVHRDVSPENIMLSRIGGVKMLDFGVAKSSAEDNRSKVGSLKGKIAYMPPEQIRGGHIDHRVDIYALGVVLYQSLSGKRPYGQATDVALITAILQDEPTPLLKHRLDLPDNLLDIVSKAMNKDPAKRFQSCAELRDALETYIAHEGQPVTTSQIAALVTAYQAANPDASGRPGQTSQPNSGSGSEPSDPGSRSPSNATGEPSARSEARPAGDAGVIDALMTEAARTNPRMRRPTFPAPAALPPELPPEPPTAPELMPAMLGGVAPLPRPATPEVPITPGRPVLPTAPAAPVAPPPAPRPSLPALAPAAAENAASQVRRYRPNPIASEPIRQVLRDGLRSDRSTFLLRKLPAVIGRLADFSRTIPWSVSEALGGVIDAAVLADDHQAIVRIVDRAQARPGRERHFAELVMRELHNPMRIAWLIERLRSGLPADTAGLKSWLARLGPSAGAMLVEALESSDAGPAQDLFAEALAYALPQDPGLVTQRLESGSARLKNIAALCFALERSQIAERARVFTALIARRDAAIQIEMMTGRARARASEALPLLEAGMGDKTDEVRRRAIELTGELGGARGCALLQRLMREPAFEGRPAPERARFWAALLQCGADAAQADFDAVLGQKPSLLNKKKVLDQKLSLIEGLARAGTEPARALLERTLNDRGQGDEVHAAVRAALSGSRALSKEVPIFEQKAVGDRRVQVIARICLDLVLLARASTTVDLGTGLLDDALAQFREALRALLTQDGRVHFSVDTAPTLNGTPITFPLLQAEVAQNVIAALQARDLKGFELEAMLPLAEFRAFFLRAFDSDGRHERLPHLKAINFEGQLLTPVSEPSAPADPTARAKEVFAALVRWLHGQRDGLRGGRALEVGAVDPLLDEWARLVFDGRVQFMGVQRWSPGDTGTLVHAVNTAALGMAFAFDLGLPRSALRELCELSLMLGLTEAVGPAERRPQPGEPTHEDQRFHAAGLLLTNRLNRLGTASAVAAIEAGLPADPHGRGPGLLASIHALAKSYDALAAGNGLTVAQALEQMNGRLKARFSADLVGLFTQWAFAQAS
ncbi:MAG: protein kinase [Archangiaceae bacterium]|nr:protein kinase [Archangiaceae bacterium]